MKKINLDFYRIIESIINIFYVMLLAPFNLLSTRIVKTLSNSPLYIMGNGPSLLDDIGIIKKDYDNFENILCMNYFILTEEFFIYKPKYYIFVDPVNFKKTNVNWVNEKHEKIMNIISKQLTWKMTVIIPWNYRFSKFSNFLKNQNNISLHYLKNTPLWGGHPWFNLMLMKTRIGNPPYQNVMVASIFWGVSMGFKEILLLGANHSWVQNLYVGIDNKVYSKMNHFYGKTEYLEHKSSFGLPISLEEELFAFYNSIKSYHLIEKLAKWKNCKIINMTENSFIDAFQKIIEVKRANTQ